MKKCTKCQVEVLDETYICPLCMCVLEQNDKEIGTQMYPTVQFNVERYYMLKRIFSFILVLIVALFSIGNYLLYNSLVGYIVVIAGAVYFAVTVRYSILHHANLAAKILVQTIGAMILIIVIDNAIGYTGWSVNYVLPCICLIANIAIMLLMIVNRMNWQEYIMYQLSMTVLSLSQLVFIASRIIDWPVLASVSVVISIVILVGTILFGDKRVENELIRRFHTK